MFDLRSLLDASVAVAAALVLVPGVWILPGTTPGVEAYAGVAVGGFLVVLAGARSAERLERSIHRRTALLALALPVASFAWFVHLAADRGVVVPALGVGAVAAVPVGAALAFAHEIRLRERTDRATELERFEARPSPRARKVILGGYAALVAGSVLVGGVLVVVSGVEDVASFAPLLGGSAGALATIDNEREVRLTDAGVRVSRTFHDWDAFAGYAVTDEALVLRRRGWRRAFRFDRTDIEGFEAVQRTLDRHLPRER